MRNCSYYLSTPASVDVTDRRLPSRQIHTLGGEVGIPLLGPVKERHWGERAFDIRDPDGDHIEFGGR